MRTGPIVHHLVLRILSARARQGVLEAGWLRLPCAIGRSGISFRKREGDGATPAGRWPLRQAFMRADRVRSGIRIAPRLRTLSGRALTVADGWCDAPGDRNYNRFVTHPYPASAERLWRDDGLYDVIVVLAHNECPRVRGHGSAIFLHCASPDLRPTEGCVAVRRSDLLKLLPRLSSKSRLLVTR